jgi:hypothetical protein
MGIENQMIKNNQNISSIWLQGTSRTGKTSNLIELFSLWVNEQLPKQEVNHSLLKPVTSKILVFGNNDDTRRRLGDRLAEAVKGIYPVISKTPLGFFSDEVILFFPLISKQLKFNSQFLLKLRPETEQDLATNLWRDQLTPEDIEAFGNEYNFVRRTLDLLQLAGASGIPPERISSLLPQGNVLSPAVIEKIQRLLFQWRDWCLTRGLLTYGLIYELYWRYLLTDSEYQDHLIRRYQGIFADDLDDYPAIAKDLFDILLDQGVYGVFTYNPDGMVRKGLNGDPDYLLTLAQRCEVKNLIPRNELGQKLGKLIVSGIKEITIIPNLPEEVESFQTISRAQLLRQITDLIILLINKEKVAPKDIAIIAPGLDDIARYSFIEIFRAHNIPIEPLNEQRPLISSPLIRSLLTLLCLIYPHLGRLIQRDSVAEMLVILSQKPYFAEGKYNRRLQPEIDPVRGGLLAEYCCHLEEENPHLLPYSTYSRWDRLGYHGTKAYDFIYTWIQTTKSLVNQEKFNQPILVLNKAINDFFASGNFLPFDQLAVLRELMETVQHFWEIHTRLAYNESREIQQTQIIGQLIHLLQKGTITANPHPINFFGGEKSAITLATIFQYRSLHSCHKYQFWLDVSSPLWTKGGASDLFGAQLFLRNRLGKPWTEEDQEKENQVRLERILKDLLARVETKVYLCHSDLSVSGTEQTGGLYTLIHGAKIASFN